MTSLFEICRSPLPEERQLKIIMRNIQPFFQAQLALVDVKSSSVPHQSVEAFMPPVRRSQVCFEPDLAYAGIEESVAEIQVWHCDMNEQSVSNFKKYHLILVKWSVSIVIYPVIGL